MSRDKDRGGPDGKNNASRRDFLGLLGMALGGVALSSCGSGSGTLTTYRTSGSISPLPNGYHFETAFAVSRGRAVGDIIEVTPIVMLNDSGQVVLYAQNSGGYGLYEASVTRGRSVTSVRPVLLTGSTTADGRVVSLISNVDFNNQGSIGVTVQPSPTLNSDGSVPSDPRLWSTGVYLEKDGSGSFNPLLTEGEAVPGVNGSFGGVYGDIDVGDNDNVLVTAFYTDEDKDDSKEGLIYIPGGTGTPQVIVSTGDEVPGSSQTVQSLGLVDAAPDGLFALQAEGDHDTVEVETETRAVAVHDVSRTRGTFVAVGRIGTDFHRSASIVAASPRIRSTRQQGNTTGEVFMGARAGAGDHVAVVTNLGDMNQVLTLDGVPVIASGQRTPSGHVVVTLGAPVIGRNGLCYYQAITQEGTEIVVTNGKDSRTILSRGDTVSGSTVNTIALGFSTDQVNSSGTMIIYVELMSGEPLLIQGEPV